MAEGIELPEVHHEEDHPLVLPVSITISIMAVLVAAVSLLGHRAHTEELLRQSQAASRWTQYDTKSVNLRGAEQASDLVKLSESLNKQLGEEMREKYAKLLEHYQEDKTDARKEALDLEAERDLAGRQADRFDEGEVLLEIGLVICSITLLTKRKYFWLGGMVIAAAGIAFAATGFFIH
ncbi:MAG TPA: DUF4337 domain-containing protein [Candidatus Angelobacter sp.]|nr:DUF4337 domain-containing protein [Candidatus Angelobacter sp.]